MAVDKVTLPIGFGVLQPEVPTDGNETNLIKINPFVTSSDNATSVVQQNGQKKGLLFGADIVPEKTKTVSKGHELPIAKNVGPLAKLSNCWKSYKSKVNEFDAAVDVVSKYMIREADMPDIINSNPRIWAIMKQGGIV